LTFPRLDRTIMFMGNSSRRFFIPRVSREDRVLVGKEEARHIRHVLRMKPGDKLMAFDGTGVECRCRIAEASGHAVIVDVLERREIAREQPVIVTLAIGATRTGAMGLIVQKCTELGLARLIPFQAGRSVARIHNPARIEKWRRTAIEAAKQCGRNVLPEIQDPVTLQDLMPVIREHDLSVAAAVAQHALPLKHILEQNGSAKKILYVIGPEGGFEADELAELSRGGAVPVSLGPGILRVETAAIAALAVIVHHYAD
jgi:16S rRNA (uracil1498-N3)-methyltransferase